VVKGDNHDDNLILFVCGVVLVTAERISSCRDNFCYGNDTCGNEVLHNRVAIYASGGLVHAG